MSYPAIELAVQTILQGMAATFAAPTDVTRGDFRVLDRGKPRYAVLTPGPFNLEPIGTFQGARGSPKGKVSWDMDIWLFEKYLNDQTAWVNLETTREVVIDKLNGAALIGLFPNVGKVMIRAGNDPTELNDEDGNGPFFLYQIIRCTIDEVK